MKFVNRIAITSALIWVTFRLLKMYPGSMGHVGLAIAFFSIAFGIAFFSLSPYMDAFALLSRRGSEATPNSNPDYVWKITGIFFIILGLATWVISQWV